MKNFNVIYLHAHDAGTYIQPYGHAVQTPHLQSLAESGMIFRQSFCVNPTCSPSRACLLTGQSAHENGMLGLAHRGFRLDDYSRTLPNFLRENGWRTALSGVQHIAYEPYASVDEIGYDEILDQAMINESRRRYSNDSHGVTQAAEDFLAREHDKPFFLDIGYFPPHRIDEGEFPTDFEVPNPAYVRPPAHLPDTEETRQDFANYMASVRTFDAYVGRIIEAIDCNGLAQNTLLIATTDHGIPFPDMKCRLTDHGIKVMLIIRGPGGFADGKVTDAMVSHLDIFPTVCEALGLAAPEWTSGQPLQKLAQDPKATLHEQIFTEVNVHAAYEPMRAVRTSRWKYIRHMDTQSHVILPNCDNGLSKSYLCDHDWDLNPPAMEELYDLVLDPMEARNLATEPDQQEILANMRDRLDKWMRDTNDPILNGPLDVTGKIITPSDAYSPSGEPRPA